MHCGASWEMPGMRQVETWRCFGRLADTRRTLLIRNCCLRQGKLLGEREGVIGFGTVLRELAYPLPRMTWKGRQHQRAEGFEWSSNGIVVVQQ